MTSKEEFFRNHNPLFIDKGAVPNWENEKYKYFVIEHSKDFRYGTFGEGEMGVTIVTLK